MTFFPTDKGLHKSPVVDFLLDHQGKELVMIVFDQREVLSSSSSSSEDVHSCLSVMELIGPSGQY